MINISNQNFKLIRKEKNVDVLQNMDTHQFSLHASKDFHKDEVICHFTANETLEEPNYLTIQLDHKKHITLQPNFLQYTNHSCAPNVFFDTTNMHFISIKNIKNGEELRFFYPSTELIMAQPFVCNCGSAECLQLVNGAANLSSETLSKYKLTNFIHQQLKHTL